MPKLSVCLIAYNEQENLQRTLESVAWVDEIILVDCESTDRTAAIARTYTKNIYTRPNLSNLNINKNYSFDQASGDWIFCLDADEVIPEALKIEILRIISFEEQKLGFLIKRKNYYFGEWLRHGGQYPDYQLRLFRREKGRFPEKHVHERLEVNGPVGILNYPFEHYPYSSLSQSLKKIDFYTSFESKKLTEKYQKPGIGLSLLFLLIRPLRRFFGRYFLKLGFLDGFPGFLACFLDITGQVITYGKFYFEYRSNEKQ